MGNFWVPAGPGDESLSLGAAFSHIYHEQGFKKAEQIIKRPSHAYWGPQTNEDDIKKFTNSAIVKKHFKFFKDKDNSSPIILAVKSVRVVTPSSKLKPLKKEISKYLVSELIWIVILVE